MKKESILIATAFLFIQQFTFSQNIGIGVINPTRARLEVNGAAGSGNTSAIFGGDGNGISLQRNWATIGFNQYRDTATGVGKYMATGYAAIQSLDANSGMMAFDLMTYGAANTQVPSSVRAISLTQSGYVGLNGAYPNAELQFSNYIDNRKLVLYESGNNDHTFYGLGINGGTLRYQVDAVGAVHRFYAATSTSSSNLLMSIWGDRKVFISSSANGGGFLGINLDAAPATLSLKQAGGTGIYLQEAASSTNWEFRAGYTAATSYAVMYLRHNGADVGFFRPTGEYVGYSDRRLKNNIETMPATLSKVMQLQPKVFEMKLNNNLHEKSLGFVAQEVRPLFPDLVFETENNDSTGIKKPLALNYAGFGVIAIKAIQEQQVQIEVLQKENKELSVKYDDLEKKVEQLLSVK